MPTKLNRRDFLKLGALFGGSIGALPLAHRRRRLPGDDYTKLDVLKTVRVGVRRDDIYSAPSLDAPITDHRYRDELVSVLEEFVSDYGPLHNPRWYHGFRQQPCRTSCRSHIPPVANPWYQDASMCLARLR